MASMLAVLRHRPWRRLFPCLLLLGASPALSVRGASTPPLASTWPGEYSVRRDEGAGTLTLATPYYTVRHDLRRGGAIDRVALTHGRATNLLLAPLETRVHSEQGVLWSDVHDRSSQVTHRRADDRELVTVEARLADAAGRPSPVRVKTVYEYRWGYIKVRRELAVTEGPVRVSGLAPVCLALAPSLSEYGYREGLTEDEGGPPFPFGSNRWGRLGRGEGAELAVDTPHVPRSMMFVDPGVEGFEWFVGSDLAEWDFQLTGRRGQGRCRFERLSGGEGLGLSIYPLWQPRAARALPDRCAFGFYLGFPLLEGHALGPWFHASFNRNRGAWVSPEQMDGWKAAGLQTVHCHNDGDYYDDGLFWRDGAYPPYPDMEKFDAVVRGCQARGIRVATYFSNKELHPSTKEFQEHGGVWGRRDRKGNLQHNVFRGQSEFGVQMCLRSGWLDFLKSSIDRVVKNHALDGVYYDWNVALFCCNGLHEGKPQGVAAAGHWDIDELLDLMEWTRRRVGPKGMVIVHNTTTPMFATENLADYVVANEWGYGRWSEKGPRLQDLPLEWSLAGARSRGVISYGQLDAKSPPRLHRLFALQASLGGVTPWPASPEAFEIFSVLRPVGDVAACRFADWRNTAVSLTGTNCASAVYSGTDRSYLVLANLEPTPQTVRCAVRLDQLPHPLATAVSARLWMGGAKAGATADAGNPLPLEVAALVRDGVEVTIPGDSAVLCEVRR